MLLKYKREKPTTTMFKGVYLKTALYVLKPIQTSDPKWVQYMTDLTEL